MTFIIYNMQEHIDKWRTWLAEIMTDRWYDQILQDIAQEQYDEYLKELRGLAKEKTKISKKKK